MTEQTLKANMRRMIEVYKANNGKQPQTFHMTEEAYSLLKGLKTKRNKQYITIDGTDYQVIQEA